MSDPNRLELLTRLGNKCGNCNETNPRVLQIDHIFGNGYLERKWFKTNKQNMYKDYVKNYEINKKYIQIRCFNCNIIKKIINKEHKNRIHIQLIHELNIPFDKLTPKIFESVLEKHPIILQTMGHQLQMIQELHLERKKQLSMIKEEPQWII